MTEKKEISRKQFIRLLEKIMPELTHISEAMASELSQNGEQTANIYIGTDGYVHLDIHDGRGTWELVEYIGKNQNPRIGYEYSEDLTFGRAE